MRSHRRPGSRTLALGLLATVLGCGLAPLPQDEAGPAPTQDVTPPVAGYPGYATARFNDFLDSLPLSVAVGPGVLATLRVPFLGTGVGWTQETYRLGWPAMPDEAVRAGTWHEFIEVGMVLAALRASDIQGYDVIYVPIGPMRAEHGPLTSEWPQILDVEAGLHLGYFGARAGVSPIQLVDFLLGWFGLDIVDDDRPRRP